MNEEQPVWSIETKLVIVVICLIGLAYVLYKFSAAIIPLILAIVIAYVLTPVVNFIQKRLRISRVLVILMVYLVLFLLFAGLVVLVIPMVLHELRRFDFDIQGILSQAKALMGQKYVVAGIVIDGKVLLEGLQTSLQTSLDPLVGHVIDVAAIILSSLVWVVFTIVISIYLIKDSQGVLDWLEQLPPPVYRQDFIHMREVINNIWSSFFRGQILLTLVVACIITLEGLLIGLRFALLMGILAGLLEFLPSLGHGIWIVLASILALVSGSTWLPIPNWTFVLLLIGLHMVYTQFDLNFLIPRIIGRSVQLPPLVVILGIVAGASLMGVLGLVLAAPSIASLRILSRYIYARLFDLDPFPDNLAYKRMPQPELRWWQKHPFRRKRPAE
jgi:predicted PurR-regulated permease PerM